MNPHLKNFARRLIILALLAAAIPLVFLSASTGRETWVQATLGPQIERELGCTLHTPTVEVLGSPRKVVAVKSITPNGIFARSGIRSHDILLIEGSLSSFYLELDSSRGKTITLLTVPGGDGSSPNHRPMKRAVLPMPPATTR